MIDIIKKTLTRDKSIDNLIGKNNSAILKNLKRKKKSQYLRTSTNILYRLKYNKNRTKEPPFTVQDVSSEYDLYINDESIVNPFIISPSLAEIIQNHVKPYKTNESKSVAIYNWMHKNIAYGTKKRRNGYKNSKEVINDNEGVCGEMAFVYVTMARCCGLRSAYVSVNRDYTGKKVHHACAIVDIGHRDVYVDPAYNNYDIHHKQTEILTDLEVIQRFNSWRR